MSEEEFPELLARPDQLLKDHLQGVARRAADFAAGFGCGDWGRAEGLLHDIGKASQRFQRYIREVDTTRKNRRGGDHSTAGARVAEKKWPGPGSLLAYCIAGHHAGLPDGEPDPDQNNEEASLAYRLDPKRRHIEDCRRWRECLGPEADPLAPDFDGCPVYKAEESDQAFSCSFFVRMLYSCLVDADRLDAEEAEAKSAADAESRRRAALRAGYPGIPELRARLDKYLRGLTAEAADTPVNRVRAEVLAACRRKAALAPGMFSLTVPTGGGKTLSSLAFALAHAERLGLERVVYVIPYTSIIEQNAKVFREALGDPEGNFVIEHHSSFVPPKAGGRGDDRGEDDRPHPATENWDAPLIVTTSVRFFESLYGARPGRCRRLHNLARSVVILDEAQMLPQAYVLPCVAALRTLAKEYGTSVVLCTATQPALDAPKKEGDDGLPGGFRDVREIMDDPVALHERLRRVEIHYLGPLTDAELAERLAAERQVLCIVPSRRMARNIYETLRRAAGSEQGGVIHLSALMCPQHRSDVLKRIKAALAAGRICRVVSTTLVEAGVDVDFPAVYRAAAGIDSIAQAAGRCNREGRLPGPGKVYVFQPEHAPCILSVRQAVQAAHQVIDRHKADLLSPDAVHDYFSELYWRSGIGKLDARHIVERLGRNAASCDFPFRTVADEFQFIDESTQALIIEYDAEAAELVRELDALHSGDRAGDILRRLQPYSVSLYGDELKRLTGAVRRTGPADQFSVLADRGLYDPEFGLDIFRNDPEA